MINYAMYLRNWKVLECGGGIKEQDEVYLAAMLFLQNLFPQAESGGI